MSAIIPLHAQPSSEHKWQIICAYFARLHEARRLLPELLWLSKLTKPNPLLLPSLLKETAAEVTGPNMLKRVLKLFLCHLWIKVLDIEIGELHFLLVELRLTLFARDVVTNVNLFIVEQHAVHGLDGILSRFECFVVNKTVSPGMAMFVSCHFAKQYVSGGSEDIMKGLVINRLIQILKWKCCLDWH